MSEMMMKLLRKFFFIFFILLLFLSEITDENLPLSLLLVNQ